MILKAQNEMSQSLNYSLWRVVYHKCIYAEREKEEAAIM